MVCPVPGIQGPLLGIAAPCLQAGHLLSDLKRGCGTKGNHYLKGRGKHKDGQTYHYQVGVEMQQALYSFLHGRGEL